MTSLRYFLAMLIALFFSIQAISPTAAKKESLRALSARVGQLVAAGQFAQALPLAKQLAQRVKARNGVRTKSYTESLRALLFVELGLGDWKACETHSRELIDLYGSIYGRNDKRLVMPLNIIAKVLSSTNRVAEAEPFARRAVSIAQERLGETDPGLSHSLGLLAHILHVTNRQVEAEPIMRRLLKLDRRNLGERHPGYAMSLNNLAQLLGSLGKMDEARALMRKSLNLTERIFGPNHPLVSDRLNNLATLSPPTRGPEGPIAMIRRAITIKEKHLGPGHPDVARDRNNLGHYLAGMGLLADAEKEMRQAIEISERSDPALRTNYAVALTNLAGVLAAQGKMRDALDYRRRAFPSLVGRGTGGSLRQLTLADRSGSFTAHARAAFHTDSSDKALRDEGFRLAQWAMQGAAAAALNQMATRLAKGPGPLADSVRKKQATELMLSQMDQQLFQALGRSDAGAVSAIREKRENLERELAGLDARLAKDFPDYALLALAKPLSISEAQKLLKADEALVLFLVGQLARGFPEETIVWVVTREQSRWVSSPLGNFPLYWEVAALRCGLDYAGSWGAKDNKCRELLGVDFTAGDHKARKPLPFDAARAHRLYQSLFSGVEDLIKDKHLLIVPTLDLTLLPFQVLVTEPADPVSPVKANTSMPEREEGWLGVRFSILEGTAAKDLGLPARRGLIINELAPSGPAARSKLVPGDVILAIDGADIESSRGFVEKVSAQAPGTELKVRIWRDNELKETAVTIGRNPRGGKLPGQRPSPAFAGHADYGKVAWLARRHAITVLPSVSALKALRRLAAPSSGKKPLIGFANPLLDGDASLPADVEAAKRARQALGCVRVGGTITASLRLARSRSRRAVAPIASTAPLADIGHLRVQQPLPETADEACAVARSVGTQSEHIYMGARSTEAVLKQLSQSGELAQYRLIHFATHGAMAGQISGADEPGLILTPPQRATEQDDGYLSASEIADLKLDADWVILSACNTAAGKSKNAGTLSGLARAFFYAGARALLVSHWAVDSEATVKLVTVALREHATDARVGRAEALRRSMLAMIDDGGNNAHPAFWAAFIVAGEGASTPR